MDDSHVPALLLIADISGFTRFMMSHKKAQAHGQLVISHLLRTLVDEAKGGLEVSKLEGDAVFMYARRPADTEAFRIVMGERIASLSRSFLRAVQDAASTSICRCTACANIDRLALKVVAHAGEVIVHDVGRFRELHGLDVIVLHRLLKNTVESNEYVLLTDSALPDVAVPAGVELVEGTESYDDIGDVKRFVASGGAWIGRPPEPTASAKPVVAWDVLRHEIKCEYREVATCPTKGFHFHTGRRLAGLVGYADVDLDAIPESAVEAFAGTGNPFRSGRLAAGEKVVDVGCGAGIDTFIAATQVGPGGRVIGVDMTPEMLERARAGATGFAHVEIREGFAEQLPVEDGWADVVISNGVLNLCPDKTAALREMHRVLRPGGRLQIGDILVQKAIPAGAKRDIDLWTG
jgi:arsenite methyltransferase